MAVARRVTRIGWGTVTNLVGAVITVIERVACFVRGLTLDGICAGSAIG